MIMHERTAAKLALYSPKRKEFLMVRGEKRIADGGRWGFVGGGIKKNETPLEALGRESEEEIGLCLSSLRRLHEIGIVTHTLFDNQNSPYFLRWHVFLSELPQVYERQQFRSTRQPITYMDLPTAMSSSGVSVLAKTSLALIQGYEAIDTLLAERRNHLRLVK